MACQPVSRLERRKIDEYKAVALSDKDLLRLLDHRARIVLYPELRGMGSLDEVLGPYGAAIILFLSQPNYGHWCWLIRGVGGDPGLVEFGNPYGQDSDGVGGYPDDSLDLLERRWAASSGQDVPWLSLLMMRSPYHLSYNQYDFQSRAKNIKTCGRHCAARILYRNLELDEYADMLDEAADETETDPDAIVTAITSEIAPKPRPILKRR
jgi:hypothetical protein